MQGGAAIICEAFQVFKTRESITAVLALPRWSDWMTKRQTRYKVTPKLVDSKTGWMYIGLHRNQTQTGIINTELMHLFVNQTANHMNVARGALL